MQGFWSLQSAAVVHCLVTMQSTEFEFGCCDGYEQASMLYTRPSTAALLRKLGGTH